MSVACPSAVAIVKSVDPVVYVVGDLNGQLEDVLHLFHEYGPPTKQCVYVFTGNIANKGAYGSEIYLLLFCYFLADSSSVIINRGNHEDVHWSSQDQSKGGGFETELVGKYGPGTLLKSFEHAWKVLPLCTVIQKKVFVAHGGLSASAPADPDWKLTLDFIKTIGHTRATQPNAASTDRQDIVWNGLLWSDPAAKTDATESGVGTHWGPDLTEKFFIDNPGIRFIVRSQELPSLADGCSNAHKDKVVTIFSASNFNGSGNKGTVLCYKPETFPLPDPIKYSAPGLMKIAALLKKGDWSQEGEAARKEAELNNDETWW